MNELAAGVVEYMNEKAAKEWEEGADSNVAEAATAPLPSAPIDAAEVNTPPGATSETPPAPSDEPTWINLPPVQPPS